MSMGEKNGVYNHPECCASVLFTRHVPIGTLALSRKVVVVEPRVEQGQRVVSAWEKVLVHVGVEAVQELGVADGELAIEHVLLRVARPLLGLL